jgi:Uma2 family endonuclease
LGEAAERLWTVEAFLARGERPGVREELVAGRIVAMAPPRPVHGVIVQNAAFEIRRRLRPPCQLVGEAAVRIDDATLFEADLAVTCGRFEPKAETVDPVLVVEVLSPSTRDFDLGRKANAYSELPSCREIWLIDSERRWVRVWRRLAEGWSVSLPMRGSTGFASDVLVQAVELDALYEESGL